MRCLVALTLALAACGGADRPTTNPHGPSWANRTVPGEFHGDAYARSSSSCVSCHGALGTPGQVCIGCHHVGASGGSPHLGRPMSLADMRTGEYCRPCHT